MGFGNRPAHILQPLIEQAKSEKKAYGKPAKKTLLELATSLVRCAPNMYSSQSYYSDQERDDAKQLLRENDLDHLVNLSPRYKARTLVLIEAEKANLAELEAEQLEAA